MKQNNKLIVIICVVIVALVTGFLIWRDQLAQSVFKVGDETAAEGDEGVYMMTYNGVEYEYNNNIMSVMLIGIDSTGKIKSEETYDNHARADNIEILILDRRTNKVSILPISRDTITPVHRYTMNGYDAGTEETHLGFAYTFGDGGKASCLNTQQAVAELLFGVEPRYYFTTNLDSIAFLNNLVGGVTVTVPNSDVAGVHPELSKGSQVTLNDSNVADFLRYRDTNANYSNNGRMERQRAFLEAVIQKLADMSADEYEDMWKKITSKDSNILTNLNNGQFVQILDKIRTYDINPTTNVLKIEGKNGSEDGYDVFYPDKDKLQQLVVDTFFIKSGDI